MSAQPTPQLSFFRLVVNVFRFGRPTGKDLPPDKFEDFFQHRGQLPLTVEEYMALRQRFSDEGFFRRERQSNVIGWVSGIMLAIMVALLQLIASGQGLPWYVKLLMALMIIVFAFISSLRVLHDHSVAQFRSDLCRQLDDRLKVKILDEQCKLPPALHKLFTVMIWVLALGVVMMIIFVNGPTLPSAETVPSSHTNILTQTTGNNQQPLNEAQQTLTQPAQPNTNANAKSDAPVPVSPAIAAPVNGETTPSAPPPASPLTKPTSGPPKP